MTYDPDTDKISCDTEDCPVFVRAGSWKEVYTLAHRAGFMFGISVDGLRTHHCPACAQRMIEEAHRP